MTARHKHVPGTAPVASGRLPKPVFWIMGVCILIELVLQAADLGLIGSPLWRSRAYQNGAFWPGLLGGWQANYTAQPALMFVTYAFLHGGFWHLAGNMFTLLVLGRIVSGYFSPRDLLLLYAISILGGAAAFGAMSLSPQPMVGASGAVFGLAAAWQYRDCAGIASGRARVWRLALGIGFLVAVNLLIWLVFDWALAWQTHLGGVVAGWIGAWLLHRRHAQRPNRS